MPAVRLVDLSRDMYHKEPGNPGAVPVQVWVWRTHEETRPLHTNGHSSTTRLLTFPDHASTHVDAPRHFDPDPGALDIASVPLDWFYGPAGHPQDRNFEVHLVCRQLGMTHMEGLANLEEIAGRRFTFCGFPLKIRDGTGSPIRAVAVLD